MDFEVFREGWCLGLGWLTYRHPNVNTRVIPIFLFVSNCKFQTTLIGIRRMMISVTRFHIPFVFSTAGASRHFPGIDLSQILTLGTHVQILTKKVAV